MQDVLALDRTLVMVGGTPITLASVVSFLVFVALSFLISAGLRKALGRFYVRRGIETGVQYALNRLLHYAVVGVGIFLALENLGVSITALAGIGAILAVGIGFGLQNIAQNFVSGLILLLERPAKQGDFVEVRGVRGSVRKIHARATIVTTLDNVDIIVPNGQFITEQVVNQTYDNRQVRVSVNVGVAYGSDTSLVRDTLLAIASEQPDVLSFPPPQVLFGNFGESALDFELQIWLGDPLIAVRAASDLRFRIDQAFRGAGIVIPFPQHDLHLKSGWPPVAADATDGSPEAPAQPIR